MRKWHAVLGGLTALAGAAACGDPTTPSPSSTADASLSAALSTVPAGYGDLATSFVGGAAASAGDGAMWVGGGRDARMGRGEMMGGGMGDDFLGAVGFGRGFGHQGPFGGGGLAGCTGTFSAATGRVACAPVTLRNGLTVVRSAAYANAQGQAQQAFDSVTTNSVNVRADVSGTLTFAAPTDSAGAAIGAGGRGGPGGRHGWGEGRGAPGRLLGDTATILSATTTVHDVSDRTVSGLAQGSTQRTVNGSSAGTETTTGTSSRGQFTASRTAGDTTTGLVVPVRTDSTAHPYPTAGTVVRSMTATLSYAGQSPVTVSRREVVTYDGSATARVVITENGTTRTCTRALPRGALTCS